MRKKKRGVTIQVIDRAAQRGLYAFIFALQTQLLNRAYKPVFTSLLLHCAASQRAATAISRSFGAPVGYDLTGHIRMSRGSSRN
jgi:hypothetical protein